MSTLPRTKSLSGTDGRNLTLNFKRDRKRPSSVCESTWNRVDLSSTQNRLLRTPSQANNLCTTVPTSLVARSLGGRHTPTKSSLKHSRNAVMAKYPKVVRKQRWRKAGGVNRVSILVISAQILVGVVGVALAFWLINWAESLLFKELPHYASTLVCLSGVMAAVVRKWSPKPPHKWSASFLKTLLALILIASVVSCSCVCIFASLHLINLAPMECHSRNNIISHPVTPSATLSVEESNSSPSVNNDVERLKPTKNPYRGLAKLSSGNSLRRAWESNDEGSGSGTNPFQDDDLSGDDQLYPPEEVVKQLEVNSESLTNFDAQINSEILVNLTICVCEKREKGWRFVMRYPNLTCNEVKNILPIFFVASCVITIVGGVLSSVLLYMLWVSRRNPYGSYGQSKISAEARPFIFRSKFKNGFVTSHGRPHQISLR